MTERDVRRMKVALYARESRHDKSQNPENILRCSDYPFYRVLDLIRILPDFYLHEVPT